MTHAPSLLPICLIGPPAAGKTTLAEALAEALHAPVVRPRDLVDAAVKRYPATAGLFHRDHLSMVPDESLGFALRVCLDQLEGLVILENLPWDVVQLVDLYRVAGRSLRILILDAPDELLFHRGSRRRHCSACYPRPVVDDGGNRCRACGRQLTARADDERGAFAERLHHRRANTSKILTLAPALHVRVHALEAGDPPDVVAGRARKEIARWS